MNSTSLIKIIRYESNSTDNTNTAHVYTDEQIQFSKQLIEQWSSFIKDGRPRSSIFKHKWPPITNMSTASIMQLQVNRSKVEKLTVPKGVQFWKNICPINTKIARKNNQSSNYQISYTLFICSLLFFKVLSLINSFK